MSRAIQQNNELKAQIGELEAEYIKQINNNANMLNNLHSQEFFNKELKKKYTDLECKHNELLAQTNNGQVQSHTESPTSHHHYQPHMNHVDHETAKELVEPRNLNDDWNDEESIHVINLKCSYFLGHNFAT